MSLNDDDLVSYEEEETTTTNGASTTEQELKKGSYVGIHATGFKDLLLKPSLMKSIVDCGFEHPSEVQQQAIPQGILGTDILCQAKSGMGKTAVFVLATLQQLDEEMKDKKAEVFVLVLAHTRELAYQIYTEYSRFCVNMPWVKVAYFYGGQPKEENVAVLRDNTPHILVGTPGRILQLTNEKILNLSKVKHFILDECDNMLEKLDMRKDVQDIFKNTPHVKQVMMFSATLSREIRPICKKFMHNVKSYSFIR